MPNEFYRKKYELMISEVIKESREIAEFDHPGLKGRFRELLIEKIFRPVIPEHYRFGSGKIMDSRGNESREIDIIIYSKMLLPPILYSERDGIFPIESCFYAFEIKSCLNKTELVASIEKANSIFKLAIPPTFKNDDGKIIFPTVPALIAFGSDLSNKTEIERYQECDPEAMSSPAIRFLCVVGKGYWYFNPEKRDWVFYEPSPTYSEVISMLCGVSNTLMRAFRERKLDTFGYYLMIDK